MTVYETHLPVKDLAASVAFYRDVVGLVPAFSQPERGVAFLWIERASVGMLGLWAAGSTWGWKAGESHRCHYALGTTREDLPKRITRLRDAGIATFGFDGQPISEPSVIGWMPSAQIYFKDPDGHTGEFLAMLDEPPVASFFGSWSEWQRRRGGAE